jgi:hypothetical protein
MAKLVKRYTAIDATGAPEKESLIEIVYNGLAAMVSKIVEIIAWVFLQKSKDLNMINRNNETVCGSTDSLVKKRLQEFELLMNSYTNVQRATMLAVIESKIQKEFPLHEKHHQNQLKLFALNKQLELVRHEISLREKHANKTK